MAISERWLIIGAFAVIYVVWGSTYLANYLAIESIPPFLMSGLRFCVAGALLYAYAVWRGHPRPQVRELLNSAWLGVLFLSIGTGGVVWAQQYIPTGMAALLVAFDPLLIMLMMWGLLGIRPGNLSLLGAVISIAGTALLVGQPQLARGPGAVAGLVAIGMALLSWGFASIYISRVQRPASRFMNSAVQMLAGGLALLLFSAMLGEPRQFSLSGLTSQSVWAWMYLVVLGSLLAFSCFNYLLTKVSPEKVATNTYVNPVVALLLGWGLNGETITGQSLVAGALLLTGVFFINIKR